MRILYEREYSVLGCVSSHAYELYPRVGYIPILKNAHLACIDHWTHIYSRESIRLDHHLDGLLDTKINSYNYHFQNNHWMCWNDWPAFNTDNPEYKEALLEEYAIADGRTEDLNDPVNFKLKRHYEHVVMEKMYEHKPFTHIFTILRNPYSRYVSGAWECYKRLNKGKELTAKNIIDFCNIEWEHDNYIFDPHLEPQHRFLNPFLNQDIPIVYFDMNHSLFDDIKVYFQKKINKKRWYRPFKGDRTGAKVFGASHRADANVIKEVKEYLFTKPSFHEYIEWEISELFKTVSYMKPGKAPAGWPIQLPSGAKYNLER